MTVLKPINADIYGPKTAYILPHECLHSASRMPMSDSKYRILRKNSLCKLQNQEFWLSRDLFLHQNALIFQSK